MMRKISKKMTGGQAKIAAKAPPRNKIDGKDFAVLRAEKAKGRGQGLQDEKLKPGKVTKAALGVLAAGLGARKRMKDKKTAPMAMGAVGAGSMKMALIKRLLGKKTGGVMKYDKGGMGRSIQDPKKGRGLGGLGSKIGRMGLTPEQAKKAKEKLLMDRFKKFREKQRNKPKTPLGGEMKKPKPGSADYQILQTGKPRPSQILPKKKMGGVMKYDKGGMGEAKGYKKYLEGLKKAEGSVFRSKYRAKEIAKAGGKAALRAAKASRIGKIALGVAAVGLTAKEFLKRKLEKRKRIQKEKTAVRTLKEDMAVQKLKESLPKKMGGGMMQRPMKAAAGAAIGAIAAGAGVIGAAGLRANKKIADKAKEKKNKMRQEEFRNRGKVKRKMGGGMMQRPMMGYKSGTMVKARGCKLGRSKPTKMY